MATRTRTNVTHWEVQWTRRRKLIDDWRQHRRTVVRKDDVVLGNSARGHRVGCYMGADGGNPTRVIDAWVHEIDPGVTTTVHRHSWDAMAFVVSGAGWTEIDGVRHEWRPWDALHLPAWAWHRSGNHGDGPARLMTYSSEPLLSTLGLAVLDDRGHAAVEDLPSRPGFTAQVDGDDPYARRVRRLAAEQQQRRAGRLHTDYDDIPLLVNPKGTRSKFLVDRSIGHQASGITQVMLQFAPGRGQAMHLHPGEAWLYVVEGRGHSYLGEGPTGGETHQWKAGDLVVVDHAVWHQHFNDDPERPARLVRVHAFDSVLETMRVLCDPLELFLEPPENLKAMGDLSDIQWPDDHRPEA
ncbi:MAG: cupin domain-containing protein, partial [Egibacteraceae bacterium]